MEPRLLFHADFFAPSTSIKPITLNMCRLFNTQYELPFPISPQFEEVCTICFISLGVFFSLLYDKPNRGITYSFQHERDYINDKHSFIITPYCSI